MSKSELRRQLRRHTIKFLVRCDVVDQAGRWWPVTIASMPDELFIGLLLLTPHSNGGRKCLAALNEGDVVTYRIGLNAIREARVAAKGDVRGSIWLRAVEVAHHIIVPVRMHYERNSRLQDPVTRHAQGE